MAVVAYYPNIHNHGVSKRIQILSLHYSVILIPKMWHNGLRKKWHNITGIGGTMASGIGGVVQIGMGGRPSGIHTKEEKKELLTKCDRFEKLKHSYSAPYAFTAQGVAILSEVLRSNIAVRVGIPEQADPS